MSKALLTYTINDNNKSITLESGTLFYIDSCTKPFSNSFELKKSVYYNDRIERFLIDNNVDEGKFVVQYIKNSEDKEKLPLLLNDLKPIYLNDDFYNNNRSEIEVARRLLFNSKNKMFLKTFLKCKKLYNTTDFLIKISYKEYIEAINRNISVVSTGGSYYVNVNNLLKYVSNNNKLGMFRAVFEDSLEAWKNKMKKLSEYEKYYYSRNLRILVNEYYKKIKINTNVVKNLNFNEKNIYNVYLSNKNRIYNYLDRANKPKYKRKVLKESYID